MKDKDMSDAVDITLCRSKVGQISLILRRLLGYKMQSLNIEIPRMFLIPMDNIQKQHLIGQAIKIHTSNDEEVQDIHLVISETNDDYQKLYEEEFCCDMRIYPKDIIKFKITLQDHAIISKLITSATPYDLNVKTI